MTIDDMWERRDDERLCPHGKTDDDACSVCDADPLADVPPAPPEPRRPSCSYCAAPMDAPRKRGLCLECEQKEVRTMYGG